MNNNLLQKTLFLCILFTLVSCAPKWTIECSSSSGIIIDSTKDRLADKQYINYLQPVSEALDKKMNVVIGQSAQVMDSGKPESLLSNFTSDSLREYATQHLRLPVDIGIMNMGGFRGSIPKGNVTLRNLYEMMPFDNKLAILWLRGDVLQKVIDEIAAKGGEGISGIRMIIKNHKAENVSVGGKSININQLYTVATSDYMSEGQDSLVDLKNFVKIDIKDILLRDIFINAFRNATAQGKIIDAKIEGRIVIEN